MVQNRNFAGLAAAGLCLLFVAACAQPAAYEPRTDGTGYTDRQLAQNRYRVTFTGNSVTSREQVEDYLLRRAAEVTLRAGYEYFIFDTRNTRAQTDYFSYFAPRWPGSPFYPGASWYWHSWAGDPWLNGGPGPTRLEAITRYEAYAEIVMLTSQQAAAMPRALDAKDVLSRLLPNPPKSGG